MEVTIIPVVRLETVQLEKGNWQHVAPLLCQKTGYCYAGEKTGQGKTGSCYAGGNVTPGKEGILLHGGEPHLLRIDVAASLDGHRMSVESRRHCLWEYTGGQLEVSAAASRDMEEGTD